MRNDLKWLLFHSAFDYKEYAPCMCALSGIEVVGLGDKGGAE